MKLFKKNENKKTTKLPMTGKVKKGFRYYCMAVMAMTFVLGTSVTAFAANDPIQVVNNLSEFHFRSGEGCWYDYARLWYRADWSFPQIPRPVPEG